MAIILAVRTKLTPSKNLPSSNNTINSKSNIKIQNQIQNPNKSGLSLKDIN